MPDVKCALCKADFRPVAMVGKKCKTCNGLYPDAESPDDLGDPNKERAHLLNEKAIKELIYETLAEAGIQRRRCEKCKVRFFSKSPATKFCNVCRVKTPKKVDIADLNSGSLPEPVIIDATIPKVDKETNNAK